MHVLMCLPRGSAAMQVVMGVVWQAPAGELLAAHKPQHCIIQGKFIPAITGSVAG